jgi:hypothetical protein
MTRSTAAIILLFAGIILSSCNKEPEQYVQLVRTLVGDSILYLEEDNDDVPFDAGIIIEFNTTLDTLTVPGSIRLSDNEGNQVAMTFSYPEAQKTIVIDPENGLAPETTYSLVITGGLTGASGEVFPGITYHFTTRNGVLKINAITLNELPFHGGSILEGISFEAITIEISFSSPLDPVNYSGFMNLSGGMVLEYKLSGDHTGVTITNTGSLEDYKKYFFNVSGNLTAANGFAFEGYSAAFHTMLDSTYKFPEITDEALLDLVQRQTFKYFYDFAHPVSGLARERNTSGEVVTSGGSGFGLMAIVAGIERGYITRQEGVAHFTKVVGFLETADRFHGAWPHWLNGSTGDVYPFSQKDDGADLVETAFLVQGLLTVRQYLDPGNSGEKVLMDRITALWEGVEWDWFTRGGEGVLYWHWSPNYAWDMNMPIRGYNEALIVYVLAAASPTHGIDPFVYQNGWARQGGIVNGREFYGITLPLGYDYGGPLFFAHYSFLGLDPRNLSDQYGNYWDQNVQHTLINQQHAIRNPNGYIGYSADCWGFTASDGNQGYSAHSPTNDRGVITPTAAISSLPFTPDASMQAIRHFYYLLGDRLWGEYGFYDAFNITEGWYANSYIAIDQGPEVVMIENHRTGLLWDLFMSAPEVINGLDKLGFTTSE